MRITYYCQHVLGIGHLHRSLEICKAIAVEHQVTLILGGPKAHIDQRDGGSATPRLEDGSKFSKHGAM